MEPLQSDLVHSPITFSLLDVMCSSELVETLQEYIPACSLVMLVSWNTISELELATGRRLEEYLVSNRWGESQWWGR